MVLCIIWVTYETDVQGHPEAFNLEDLVIQHCSVVALPLVILILVACDLC